MQEYIDKKCAECGEIFKEGDDIAVCPDCGTPIHRSCWKGKCPNADKHGTNYEWGKTEENEDEVCAVCGRELGPRPVYCPSCGTPMHLGCYIENGVCPNAAKHTGPPKPNLNLDEDGFVKFGKVDDENTGGADNTEAPNNPDDPKVFVSPFESFEDMILSKPIKNPETGETLTCNGVTQEELLFFLGKRYLSTPRYISIFLRMANTGKRVSFNLWAGLFMPFYQFYQKMIAPGFALLLLYFILELPALMWRARELMSGTGEIPLVIGASLDSLISIFAFVNLGVQILIALFGDYFYMRWSVGKILSIREKYANLSPDEYHAALEKAGNPKWIYILLGFGMFFALSYLAVLLYMP